VETNPRNLYINGSHGRNLFQRGPKNSRNKSPPTFTAQLSSEQSPRAYEELRGAHFKKIKKKNMAQWIDRGSREAIYKCMVLYVDKYMQYIVIYIHTHKSYIEREIER
jgi:hypothetical protein